MSAESAAQWPGMANAMRVNRTFSAGDFRNTHIPGALPQDRPGESVRRTVLNPAPLALNTNGLKAAVSDSESVRERPRGYNNSQPHSASFREQAGCGYNAFTISRSKPGPR
jgi:hypothetical protein